MDTKLSKDDQLQPNAKKEDQATKSRNWGAGDLVFSGLLIVFAILMIVGALNFPKRARMGVITSPAFTPILLSILIIVLSLILVGLTLKKYGRVSIPSWFKEVIANDIMQRSYILMVIIGVYILSIGRIHFLISNLVFLAVMYWFLKIGTWKTVLIYTIASSLLISVVVPYVFQMPLPFK